MTPKIRTATPTEVEAVLPQELLVTTPANADAQARYGSLERLLKSYETPAPAAVRPGMPIAAPIQVWTIEQIDAIERIVDSGPLQPSSERLRFQSLLPIEYAQNPLSATAELCAKNGDRQQAIRCLMLSIRISNGLMSSDVGSEYALAASFERKTDAEVARFAQSAITRPDECAALLRELGPAPVEDRTLALSTREDFQRFELPALPNPYKGFKQQPDPDESRDPWAEYPPMFSNWMAPYDAIETAGLFGRVISTAMANTKRPYRLYDPSGDRIVEMAEKNIPKDPDMAKTGFRRSLDMFRYRLVVNNSHNLMGQYLLSVRESLDREQVLHSLRWRTLRDTTRVLLASRLFRAAHHGALPKTTKEFLPYLGKWPTDLYDEQPMRYDSRKAVVYSVGPDLRDDGGDIFGKPGSQRDFGISLAVAAD